MKKTVLDINNQHFSFKATYCGRAIQPFTYRVTLHKTGETITDSCYEMDTIEEIFDTYYYEYIERENTPDKIRRRMNEHHFNMQLNNLNKSRA